MMQRKKVSVSLETPEIEPIVYPQNVGWTRPSVFDLAKPGGFNADALHKSDSGCRFWKKRLRLAEWSLIFGGFETSEVICIRDLVTPYIIPVLSMMPVVSASLQIRVARKSIVSWSMAFRLCAI